MTFSKFFILEKYSTIEFRLMLYKAYIMALDTAIVETDPNEVTIRIRIGEKVDEDDLKKINDLVQSLDIIRRQAGDGPAEMKCYVGDCQPVISGPCYQLVTCRIADPPKK